MAIAGHTPKNASSAPKAKGPASGTSAGAGKGARGHTLEAVKKAGTLDKQKAIVKPKAAHGGHAGETHGEQKSAGMFDHPLTTMTEMVFGGPKSSGELVDQAFVEKLATTAEGRARLSAALSGDIINAAYCNGPMVGSQIVNVTTALRERHVTKDSI
jgi:hypothetical protein